jgi:alpha-glucosidase (family GH31 glycosyl hydrolase)
VDIETLPLYIRAGALIPMGPVKQYTAEAVDGPLTVWVHPGADGTFSLYEDDGKTFNYRKGEFSRLEMAWNDRRRQLTLRLGTNSKLFAAARKNITVRVAGESTSREIVFERKPIVVQL